MTIAEYIENVKAALEDGELDLSLSEYVDALEEVESDVQIRLDSAREDLSRNTGAED